MTPNHSGSVLAMKFSSCSEIRFYFLNFLVSAGEIRRIIEVKGCWMFKETIIKSILLESKKSIYNVVC